MTSIVPWIGLNGRLLHVLAVACQMARSEGAAVDASALARSVIARLESTTVQHGAALRRAILAAPVVRE